MVVVLGAQLGTIQYVAKALEGIICQMVELSVG